jgi:ribonuclease HII
MTERKKRTIIPPLEKFYMNDTNAYEIGVDEAGRGPLFGRVYSAAVILPKRDDFKYDIIKDSKRFSSKKKLLEVADYIKTNALAWNVQYQDEKIIDTINILQATQRAMHYAIDNIIDTDLVKSTDLDKILLLIDGNYFNKYSTLRNGKIQEVSNVCIEGGDNKYTSIAAASILAKVERDNYIEKLCEDHPELSEKYSINSNKGYGAKKHIEGIKQHGITQWHRKSYGICKQFK